MSSTSYRRRARLKTMWAPQAAAGLPAPSSQLEISSIDLFPLREPQSRVEFSVLRVQTKSGLKGYGETVVASAQQLAALRQFWIGRPATSYAITGPESPLSGAIDMALLDLIGKHCNVPTYRVLGGPTRNKVRAYASLHAESSIADLRAAAQAGYRAFGLRIPAPAARNQGQAYQIALRAAVDSVRAQGGDFVLEADGLLTPGDAATVAAGVQGLHPLWFDEPCAVTNLQTLRKISEEAVVPVGFGRDVRVPSAFQDLLRAGLIDVVRPDLHHFGITQTRRIAALAETYYVALAPRHSGGPIATAAALQLAASLPNFFIQQIPFRTTQEDRAMRAALTGNKTELVTDGFASLPTGPGLGINVDERVLEQFRAA